MTARKRKCPTPDKVKYKTRDAAMAALRHGRFSALQMPTRAYWCRGGHYHLTCRA